MVEYVELRCEAPTRLEDQLTELVACFSSLGSEIAVDDHGRLSISVYFHTTEMGDAHELAGRLRRGGATDVVIRVIPDRDWIAPYRQLAKPFEIGQQWWIDPRPDKPARVPEGRIRLVIEPSQAFGSGSHESTRLILHQLEDIDVVGRRVLDVGTGSGILAFAAAALSASLVIGLDLDPQAVWEANRNIARQDAELDPRFLVSRIDGVAKGSFDLALCNMLTRHSESLLPALGRRLIRGGRLVLSGMVDEEIDRMTAELQGLGGEIEAMRTLEGWAVLRVVFNGSSR
jgi:ribosomal protein L11 methyltransferase